MALSPSIIRFLVVTFVALGSFTYGYGSSIIATTLGQTSFIEYFELDSRENASALIGAINGLFQAGGLVGVLSCIGTADWLGRRKALIFGSFWCLLGGALQAGSINIGMMLAARFFTGIGVGALVTLVPLYQSEIAPPKIRGLLVGMHGVLIGTGYAVASWVGVGFYFVNANGNQWRVPLAIQCISPLLLAAGIMFVPESPRWLILNKRDDEAFEAFKSLRSESSDAILGDEDATRADFELLHKQCLHEMENKVSMVDFFKQPSLRKRCIIGFLTTFGCQCTATIVINNYGPSIYKGLGYNTVQQLLIQAAWVSTAPFGNYINAAFVDRFGRVKMLTIGFVGCLIALIGACVTISIFSGTGSRTAASAATFFLFLHIAFFVLFCDATSYVYASEIFPTPLRARGLSISVSGLFVATIIFTTAAPTAFANIGWKYYLVFVVLTALITLYAVFYFPETSGRSLEEIQALFGDSVEGIYIDSEEISSPSTKGGVATKDEKVAANTPEEG